MSRRFVALVSIVSLALIAASVSFSSASFTSVSSSTATVLTDDNPSWLHQYSQSTDPGGLTGYATRRNSSPLVPAATGMDYGLACNVGQIRNTTVTMNRVWTVMVPGTLPGGFGQVTVTATTGADPGTGLNPFQWVRISRLNGTGAASTVTIPAGEQWQVNMRIRTNAGATDLWYHPTVTLTISYAGSPANYYQYTTTVDIWDGAGLPAMAAGGAAASSKADADGGADPRPGAGDQKKGPTPEPSPSPSSSGEPTPTPTPTPTVEPSATPTPEPSPSSPSPAATPQVGSSPAQTAAP